MKIRLTRKFPQLINGIDLSNVREGDTIDLSPHDADMLVAEGWAVLERHRAHERSAQPTRAGAVKSKKRAKKKR